jgi:PHD/YefM family antitoxin component YafN of YafNO toxin-antitoxin module
MNDHAAGDSPLSSSKKTVETGNSPRSKTQIKAALPQRGKFRPGKAKLKTFSSADFRSHFSNALNCIFYADEIVTLSRRGLPLAVVVSPNKFKFTYEIDQVLEATKVRDNLSEIINLVGFGKKIIAVVNRGEIRAHIIPTEQYAFFLDRTGAKEELHDWNDVVEELETDAREERSRIAQNRIRLRNPQRDP